MRRVLVLILGLWICSVQMFAQPPSALFETADPPTRARYSALYADRPPFVIGWNWGAAMRQANEDLKTNMIHAHYPFAYSTPRYREPWVTIESYPAGTRLIIAPQWFLPQPLIDSVLPWFSALQKQDPRPMTLDLGKGNRPSLAEAIGIRFQPELDLTDTLSFTPRPGDTQGAVWGFRFRDRQATREVVAPGEQHFESLIIERDTDTWRRVLGSSWPQDRFCEWVNLSKLQQMAPFNGRRNYLSVRLRRTGASTDPADSVLRLRVYYTRAGSPDTNLIVFDSIPRSQAAWQELPPTLAGIRRGYRQALQGAQGGSTEMIVRWSMLPAATDSQQDITIMAHFLADGLQNPRFRDRWRTGLAFSAQERRDGIVDRLWVEVDHRGPSVAVDWIQIGTENMTWLTQGWYDRIFATAYEDMARNMAAYNRLRFGTDSASHIRIWRWYMRDEAPEAWWEGIRYVNTLFDGRGITENELDVDHARFRHLTKMDHSWEGLTLKITPNVLVPFYDHGHGGIPEKVPLFLGYRFGVKDVAWQTKQRLEYDTHPEVGLQAPYEETRHELKDNPRYLFAEGHDWMANLWLSGDWVESEDGSLRGLSYTPRQLTGEEASLLAWSHIILGAKGLIYYWGSNADSLTQLEHYRSRGYVPPGIAYGPVRPNVVRYDVDPAGRTVEKQIQRTPEVASARSTWQHQQPARSITAGEDWLTPDNPTGFYQALEDASSVPLSEALQRLIDDPARRQFYLGWLSVRSALQRIGEVCTRAGDTLADLSLKAWHARGFEAWTLGQGALDSVIDVTGIRTRHPMRPAEWDPDDDTFVEVSLLKPSSDSSMVLGVLNRRCDPHDLAAEEPSIASFLPFEDHRRLYEDRGYRQAKYRQRGSRLIALPLSTSMFRDGRTWRVSALGRGDVQVEISGPTTLMVPLLPGEGMMLWCAPLSD